MASRINHTRVRNNAVGPTDAVLISLAAFRAGGVGLLVTIPTGTTASYNVEVTGSDNTIVNIGPTGTGDWNLHDTLQNMTASANGNIGYPVVAVRLNVLSISSQSAAAVGYVVMHVVQGG